MLGHFLFSYKPTHVELKMIKTKTSSSYYSMKALWWMTSQSLLGGFWERQVVLQQKKTLVFHVGLASVSDAVESHLIP